MYIVNRWQVANKTSSNINAEIKENKGEKLINSIIEFLNFEG